MVTNSDKNLEIIFWVLKIGVFGIFLGHGIYAIQVQQSWVPFLEIIGFSNEISLKIMPYIGYLDILVAISVLIKPLRFILIWAVFWAFLTALMRPIAGGSILDFIERSGNWATPLALLLLLKWKK
ncbi:MAG TPA: hypothetical protein DDZ39_01610 [Flavobacteriaceae bacterium]|jgi:hypothetical protein|nr:hypothetical protein [Flavobacteriaceae bacterium]HBS11965.1 hypothetical protein [Flavobacteriaceae bacterium]